MKWFKNLSVKSAKLPIKRGGKNENHCYGTSDNMDEKALHHMASESLEISIAFLNTSIWLWGSVVPSYNLRWTRGRYVWGIGSIIMSSVKGWPGWKFGGISKCVGRYERWEFVWEGEGGGGGGWEDYPWSSEWWLLFCKVRSIASITELGMLTLRLGLFFASIFFMRSCTGVMVVVFH